MQLNYLMEQCHREYRIPWVSWVRSWYHAEDLSAFFICFPLSSVVYLFDFPLVIMSNWNDGEVLSGYFFEPDLLIWFGIQPQLKSHRFQANSLYANDWKKLADPIPRSLYDYESTDCEMTKRFYPHTYSSMIYMQTEICLNPGCALTSVLPTIITVWNFYKQKETGSECCSG